MLLIWISTIKYIEMFRKSQHNFFLFPNTHSMADTTLLCDYEKKTTKKGENAGLLNDRIGTNAPNHTRLTR